MEYMVSEIGPKFGKNSRKIVKSSHTLVLRLLKSFINVLKILEIV